MPIYWRAATLLVVAVLMLTACADPTAQAITSATTSPATAASVPPTALPTSAPTNVPPTAVPLLAKNVLVAGVDIGELPPEEARRKLDTALAPLLRPLDLQAGSAQLTLAPEDIDLQLPLDSMIAAAQSARANERVPLEISYDQSKMRTLLAGLAQQASMPPAISVISSTKTISRSFLLDGGERLDIDAAAKQIDDRLHALGGSRRITLALTPDTSAAARPTPAELQAQIEAMADRWDGIVGLYVYDLANDQVLASLNQDTVFSGASVMKVPILLQSYIQLPSFSADQEKWLKKMIVDSDNLSANAMLAASASGSGTDDALIGTLAMSDMMKSLGLEHTYQYMPYEASEYLIKVRKIQIKRGPAHEGAAPFTEPDPVLRTTPAEMSRVFLLINQCSQSSGILLEKFAGKLSPARCQEMLDRLAQNGDHARMVAGLPAGTRVEHKSGWIEDMQADVGIVHSPGGDFLMAIYLYRDIVPGKTYLSDTVAMPVLASFARLIYSYYNPLRS
jgi:beta-lactamase class A